MQDAFQTGTGGSTAIAFRQLSFLGPAGTELSTILYVGMSMALGVLVGVTLADRSWPAVNPIPSQDFVQVNSSVVASDSLPVEASGQALPLAPRAVTEVDAHPESASRTADTTASTTPTHRSFRALATGKRHRSGRRAHGRHRIHARAMTTVSASPAVDPEAIRTNDEPELFSFTVQGDLTVFNYDTSAGTLETYEGQTFTLDRTMMDGGVTPVDFPPNIHYTCDQSGKCVLIHAGAVIANARRIL